MYEVRWSGSGGEGERLGVEGNTFSVNEGMAGRMRIREGYREMERGRVGEIENLYF